MFFSDNAVTLGHCTKNGCMVLGKSGTFQGNARSCHDSFVDGASFKRSIHPNPKTSKLLGTNAMCTPKSTFGANSYGFGCILFEAVKKMIEKIMQKSKIGY